MAKARSKRIAKVEAVVMLLGSLGQSQVYAVGCDRVRNSTDKSPTVVPKLRTKSTQLP
jgi:hypothetical protein